MPHERKNIRYAAQGSAHIDICLVLSVASQYCTHAAQETRELKRREKEWSDGLINKYYAEQRHMDAAAASAGKDDVRRREREAHEREAERSMVESMFRVRILIQCAAAVMCCARSHVRHCNL